MRAGTRGARADRRRRWVDVLVGPWFGPALLAVVVAALAVLVARGAAGPDTVGPFGRFSFVDFRDTVWNPTRYLLDGGDPYDIRAYRAALPSAQEFSLYSPTILVLGLPFAVLPLPVAAAAWFVVQLVSLAFVARTSLRWAHLPSGAGPVCLTLAVLLMTPIGRQAVTGGQYAAVAVAGVLLACTAGSTWWAAVGVALAVVKPQAGLPLLALLVVCGRWRRVLAGLLVVAVTAGPVALLLAQRAGGVGAWVGTLRENLSLTYDSPFTAAGRPDSSRVDLPGLLARWGVDPSVALTAVVALGTLAVTLVLARRFRPDSTESGVLAASTLAAVVLLATPNEGYACVVALPAALAGLAALVRGGAQGWSGALPGLASAVPFVHVGAVDRAIGLPAWWEAGLNTAGLVVGGVVLPAVAWVHGRAATGQPVGRED